MADKQSRVSFYDQIAKNKWSSFFLILIIFLVVLGLVVVIGLILQVDFFIILIFGIVISIIYVLASYYGSAKLALASVKAQPADENVYRQYYDTVEGLTIAAGMPMPKLYVMNDDSINAFASGRNPKNSVICVTTGALRKLTKQELEGVLGHELSHVANYDIRFMTIAAIMVGMVAIISEIFLRSLFFGAGNRDREGGGGAIIMIIGIVLAIIAPIVVVLVQLAISRRREYAADASSVKFIRSPTGLIGALKKIQAEEDSPPLKVPKAVAPLFIGDPFKKNLDNLLSTHPPLEKRIAILEKM